MTNANITVPAAATATTTAAPALSAETRHDLAAGHLCLNCGHAAPEKYCAHCGQNTHSHPPSAVEFLHEFIGHYVALEGKLWSSLIRLLFRPGNLTREYVEGRRVRYVNPLRLYLTMSVLFFALLKFSHFTPTPPEAPRPVEATQKSAAKAAAQGKIQALQAARDDDEDSVVPGVILDGSNDKEDLQQLQNKVDRPGSFAHLLIDKGGKLFKRPSEEIVTIMTEGFAHYAPYAMFCLLPLFALLLKLLYIRHNRNYGEHVVFAMHTNAFAFAMFFCVTLAPWSMLRAVLILWLIAYLPLALHQVYRGRIALTVLRWVALLSVYGVCLILALLLSLGAVVALY